MLTGQQGDIEWTTTMTYRITILNHVPLKFVLRIISLDDGQVLKKGIYMLFTNMTDNR